METTVDQALLEEFDPEMRNARRTLERIRDDALCFKPHPKSMSMGQLAIHIAEMIGWAGKSSSRFGPRPWGCSDGNGGRMSGRRP